MAAVEQIPIKNIVIKPGVNRKAISAESIAELAASIKERGLLQPVLVHMLMEAKGRNYELIAGERRVKAVQHNGDKTIDARVFINLSEDEIGAMRLVENLQREGLTPFEEAEQLARLQELSSTRRLEDLADRVGKSPSWVANRLAVHKLVPELRNLVTEQDWPLSFLPLLARVPADGQAEVLKRIKEEQEEDYDNNWTDHIPVGDRGHGWKVIKRAPSLQTLKEMLQDMQHHLAKAPWKKDDPLLVVSAGSCDACSRRSGAQELLFPELAGDDRCLDPQCWQAKEVAFVASQALKLRSKGTEPIVLSEHYSGRDDESEALKEAIGPNITIEPSHKFEKCKKNDPKARPAVVANGPRAGTIEYVKPHSWNETPAKKKAEARGVDQATGKTKPPTTKERLTTLTVKRQCRAVEIWVERLENLKPKFEGCVDVMVSIFGVDHVRKDRSSEDWVDYHANKKSPDWFAWEQLHPVFADRLRRDVPMEDAAEDLWEEAENQATALGELEAWELCWSHAVKEIPLPKTLAKDGVKDPEAHVLNGNGSGRGGTAREGAVTDFATLMVEARDADEGRDLLHQFEEAVNAAEVRAGTKPSVGKVDPKCTRGFSTLNKKEMQAIAKKSPECADLVKQWPEINKAWGNLCELDVAGQR